MQEKKTDKKVMWSLFFALVLAIVFLRLFDGAVVPAFKAALHASTPFVFGFIAAYLLIRPVKLLEKLFVMMSKNKSYRWHRIVSTIIVFLIFIGFCVVIVAMLIPQVYADAKNLITQLPDYIPKAKALLDSIMDSLSGIAHQDWQTNINDTFSNIANKIMQAAPDLAAGFALGTFRLVINIVIGTIAAFYIVFDYDKLKNLTKRILRSFIKVDNTYYEVMRFLRETDRIISTFIIGRLISSTIVGVVCFIGFSIVGVKSNFLVCTIIAITNLIPYIGPFIGAVPPLLITVIDDPRKAFWVALIVLIVQQLEGNIIGPKILGDMLKVSPFWILIGVVLGGAMFGLAGTLLGAPCVALIAGIMREFMELRSIQREARWKRESENKEI